MWKRISLTLATIALLGPLTLLAAQKQPAQPPAATATPGRDVQMITSPAGAGSMAPQLFVSTRGVLMSWVERSGRTATLRFSELTRGAWSVAKTAASGEDWFVNWADVPSVRRLTNGTLVAHWLQKSAASTYAYDVKMSYSSNDDVKWSTPFSPHHDDTPTEHGFVSLFETATGVGLVWLDGRAMAPMAGMDHGAGDMTLRYAAFDRNWKQTADQLIDARVCECCPTAVTVTSDGPIAAFRNRSDDETRDIFVSRLDNGRWSQSSAAVADKWKIDACPVNGPSLSARGRDVAIAWFTGKNNENRVFTAFSKDSGRTFGPAIRLDDAKSLGRVDIELMADGAAIAAWMESTSDGAELRIRRINPDGTRSASQTITRMSSARSSGYPRMARNGDELIFSWTEVGTGGAVQVRTASARVDR